ncbi:MAG: SAM-dependent chlorinase/fluorinase [Methylacidiphilales bacterium]|nr:SAM-dependent chlorinase/fluorinase [Candidatus Methylacidiphilales bacterium]MDW8348750.1 SAM-dependent chlorinase/fluorinase [Verrucomicrobiae bacterium]
MKGKNAILASLIISLVPLFLPGCKFDSSKTSPRSPQVFLITEFPIYEPYVAEICGQILSIQPEVRIQDLIRTSSQNSLSQNAVILDQIAYNLPQGSIILAILNTAIRAEHPPLLVKTKKNKFYIVPDNSLITLVLEREGLEQAWRLNVTEHHAQQISNTYPYREIYASVTGKLASGIPPEKLGTPTRDISKKHIERPSSIAQTITAKILHIDSYGNLITNVPKDFSPILIQDSMLRVDIGKKSISAPLVKDYRDVPVGRFALVFNNQNLLELTVHQGSAASEFKNITPGTTITILP